MREIKFRAWYCNKITTDEEAKRLLYNNSSKSKAFHTDAIIMQFTGLLDKNGKEIYEGDVVKFRSHPSKEHVGKVEYSNGHCRFHIVYFMNELERERKYSSWQLMGNCNYIQIIGNIYENSDLLK